MVVDRSVMLVQCIRSRHREVFDALARRVRKRARLSRNARAAYNARAIYAFLPFGRRRALTLTIPKYGGCVSRVVEDTARARDAFDAFAHTHELCSMRDALEVELKKQRHVTFMQCSSNEQCASHQTCDRRNHVCVEGFKHGRNMGR